MTDHHQQQSQSSISTVPRASSQVVAEDSLYFKSVMDDIRATLTKYPPPAPRAFVDLTLPETTTTTTTMTTMTPSKHQSTTSPPTTTQTIVQKSIQLLAIPAMVGLTKQCSKPRVILHKIHELAGKSVTATLLLFENLLSPQELAALTADFSPKGLLYNELGPEKSRFGGSTLRMSRPYADTKDIVYRYAGAPVKTGFQPMPASVATLRTRAMECLQSTLGNTTTDPYMLANFLQQSPNYCLVNFYPDGKAGIGKHADNFSDMVPFAPIHSYSFGSERTFIVFDKVDDTCEIARVAMPVNSLVVMCGAMQSFYKHAVNAQTSVKSYRVNITYRYIPVESKPESTKKRTKT